MVLLKLYPTYQIFLTAGLALIVTAFLMPLWIKILTLRHMGQIVRTDGPERHLEKEGTPTMGGVLILLAAVGAFVVMSQATILGTMAVLTTLSCGLLGFFDDFSKIARARSLGLKARTKLFTEFIISIVVGIVAVNYYHLPTAVKVPFSSLLLPLGKLSFVLTLGGISLVVPWIYLIFIFVIIAATTNSVNLTDGLDGLAAGTITIVVLAFAGIAFKQNHLDLAIFCAAVAGVCVGFLWYNSYPARIFMGDAGSLGLGGAIAILAILTKTELLLILIGGIYVLETLSVIIQVVSYRVFGRRVFKMAPIHHHFEIAGWSETQVMIRFWIVSGLLAGVGFALYFAVLSKGGG